MKGKQFEAGRYYGVTHDGQLEEAPAAVPDWVICRRVADYPGAAPPAGAEIDQCETCCALIAYNPRGPYPTVPRRCMQCAGVRPLPFPPAPS